MGSKTDGNLVRYARLMALRGYVAASINYRLLGNCLVGAAPAGHDVRAAIRYVRSQALAWNIDPERVAVMGSSAGAIAGRFRPSARKYQLVCLSK